MCSIFNNKIFKEFFYKNKSVKFFCIGFFVTSLILLLLDPTLTKYLTFVSLESKYDIKPAYNKSPDLIKLIFSFLIILYNFLII